ncbi:MAG TPA: nickel-responsive transcriptional regulator NikR [Urbifossiella sp.]|jgi:CopG family nickel-responsive transcriptional regulator
MSELVRFSASLEDDLLVQFDEFIEQRKLATRSEALRQLIREKLTSVAWATDATDVAASLTLVYDHHRSKLTDKMIEIQHAHGDRVVSSMHIHLNHDLCMELIALRGPAAEIQRLADELSGLKGIFQAQLVIARAAESETTDHAHPHSHSHPHSHPHSHKHD